jgi:hypothetical protein
VEDAPWSAAKKYWVDQGDGADPTLTDGHDLQEHIASSHIDPKAVLVCPEGQDQYRPAADLGFRDSIPW